MAVRTLIDLLLPTPCAGCGREGVAWCPECASALGAPRRIGTGGAPAVWALGRYAGSLRAGVLAYKERGRRDLATALGAALAAAVPALPAARPDAAGTWWLVPAPSRRSATRRRGVAPVPALAAATAAALAAAGAPAAVAPALQMAPGVRDSVGLDAAARAANLAGRVRVVPAGLPPPETPVVLLDDVLTTGATLAACAAALRRAGVPATAAVVLAAARGHQLY